MQEIISDVKTWLDNKEDVVLATVIHTWGSSPRGLGAKMAFTPGGKITGSVSGGCVEGQVYESGIGTLKTWHPTLLRFGVSDESAFEVGLACGGKIEIFVNPIDRKFFAIESQVIEAYHSLSIVTIVDGPDELLGKELMVEEGGSVNSGFPDYLDVCAISLAKEGLIAGESKNATITTREGVEIRVFVDVIIPSPTLVMVGGVHIAIALSSLAKTLGYRTIVVDPRRSFGNAERFPHVDQLIQDWPQEAFQLIDLNRNTYVAVLTHDPKIDDPAIEAVILSPAAYIGVLGSQTTNKKRIQRLEERGFSPDLLKRLHAPIGMDLGAKSPEELALSIMAEIVAVRRRRTK